MRAYKNFSPETMAFLQAELYAFLEQHGPATKRQIIQTMPGWYKRKAEHVLMSQPEWLVGVGTTRSDSKFGRLVLYHCKGEHVLGVCECGRKVFSPSGRKTCASCDLPFKPKVKSSRIVPGVDVRQPTKARPGSEAKQDILGARLDAGLPLWHEDDDYDANPGWVESQEEPDEDE